MSWVFIFASPTITATTDVEWGDDVRRVLSSAHGFHQSSVSRASSRLQQEEDGEADDEPRHGQRQRRRRSTHAQVLKEALAGGHLDGDRGGEADHGRAAQPCVRPAALLRALLAPDDGQRPAADGPAGDDAPLAGRRRCCVSSFDDGTHSLTSEYKT
uniref:Uncharacterized protein n=1 Tax=Zea mays TaxID=4577 RepID=C0PIZ7_MAIZE|nr:unknown [Zea mays]